MYCITPDQAPDGSLDFASLRNLLSFIAALRQNGVLQSARILCGESVTDGLRAMSTDTLSCFMVQSLFASEGALPLAFLIETSEPIRAKKVGNVFKRQSPLKRPPAETVRLRESLIWSDRPHVAVFARRSDFAAKQLEAELIKEGAEVTLLHGESEEVDQIAHALLNAQTLILCGKVQLPQTERIRFALETFSKAGGNTLLVGGATIPQILDATAFPNGIPSSVIASVCKKTE